MVTYTCDGCGKVLARDALRYTVKIDIRAAYDTFDVSLVDMVRNHRSEIARLIERLKEKDPKEIEETVYKKIELDLCPACQKAFIGDPLHFHPEQGEAETDFDVDHFLRTLGYGKRPGEGG